MGYVDPKQIGINGHSYGGEGRGVHRHAVAAVRGGRRGRGRDRSLFRTSARTGAGRIRCRAAAARTATTTTCTVRAAEGVSPWDKPEMYMFESALTHVPEVTAPFLIMHGTADPTVAFQNGLALLQRAALQQQERGAARVPGRRPRPARPGESEGFDDPLFPVLRSLPEGRAGAEVDDGRRAVPEERRFTRRGAEVSAGQLQSTLNACVHESWRKPGMHQSTASGSIARAAIALPMSAPSQPN